MQEANHKESIPYEHHSEPQQAHDDMMRLVEQSITSASITQTRTRHERQQPNIIPTTLLANDDDDEERSFCIVVKLAYRKSSLEP